MNCIKHPFTHPLFTKRFNRRILEYLQSIAPGYDVLYFDYTQTAIYSLFIDHPDKVIRCHDIMAQKFYRQHPFLLPWIKHSERKLLSSAAKVFVPSDKDARIVSETYGISSLYTHECLHDFDFPKTISAEKSFVFFGLWSRKENLNGLVWFVKNVLPLVKHELRNSFSVMGGGLSEQNRVKYLEENNIEYLGFVKDCYGTIVRKSAVIVPLFEGAGVKVKVLDSFTTGTPVIGTELAFEGIPFVNGLQIQKQTAQDFADAINDFTPLVLEEKKKCQKNFLEKYNNYHLADFL